MKAAHLRPVSSHVALYVLLFLSIPSPTMAQPSSQAPSSQSDLRTSDAGAALAGAMTKLATSPRDLDALLTAGEASLKLEDPRSALGFFGRADDVSPNNGRVKAGLGRSMLQLDQVGDGLRLMEQAGNLGYTDAELLADRALARDLTGNQKGAQQDYAAALRLDPGNQKVIRRQAVSFGISGQLDLAEKALEPLLYKGDRAAWRDRAFILAMNGRTAQALKITNEVMPSSLAGAIEPYMERMSMLTPGQRAAAVHMGRFPPGLIDMPVKLAATPAKAADASPTPLPSNDRRARKKGRADVGAEQLTPAQPVAGPQLAEAAPPPKPKPAPSAPSAAINNSAIPGSAPASPSIPPPSAEPRTLADIMAGIKIPTSERRNDVVPVNLAEIAAMQEKQRKVDEAIARKKAAAEARAREEAAARAEKKRLADNPARYWLQIGVGRDKNALPFTLRRMKKDFPALDKQDGWYAPWGRTNRLVVGPFSNLAKAKSVEAELKKGGSDAFVWRSDAGEELMPVGGK